MKTMIVTTTILLFALQGGTLAVGAGQGDKAESAPPLTRIVENFDLADKTLMDGIAQLSTAQDHLHIGVEHILRDKHSDSPVPDVRFSLHLKHPTVRYILDTLCKFDARYTWSVDHLSINIYPRSTAGDHEYLLNQELRQISLDDVPDADQTLTPLARQLPREQLGYVQAGGDVTYLEPWKATFHDLTVRQFINRVAEHLGPSSSWIFQGSKDERMFTFQKGGLHTNDHDQVTQRR
jgi:hypothetical protein